MLEDDDNPSIGEWGRRLLPAPLLASAPARARQRGMDFHHLGLGQIAQSRESNGVFHEPGYSVRKASSAVRRHN